MICHFAILFLNKAIGKDESLEDLSACGFYFSSVRPYFGCRIDEASPPGYKCFCSLLGGLPFVFTCNGRGQKCRSEKEYGCNGCKESQCCAGNCDGHYGT